MADQIPKMWTNARFVLDQVLMERGGIGVTISIGLGSKVSSGISGTLRNIASLLKIMEQHMGHPPTPNTPDIYALS